MMLDCIDKLFLCRVRMDVVCLHAYRSSNESSAMRAIESQIGTQGVKDTHKMEVSTISPH